MLVFYPIAIYLSFKAYREYKGMLLDSAGAASNSISMPRPPQGASTTAAREGSGSGQPLMNDAS